MTDHFARLMLQRFIGQRDEYLTLVQEQNQTDAQRVKVFERLRLLGRLLELEGKKVQLPKSGAKPRRRGRAA